MHANFCRICGSVLYMEHQPPLRRTSIAAEIRAEVARQKVSKATLAQATDIHVDTLRRRLDGHMPFYAEELVAICHFLNIPVAELLERAEKAA